MTDQEWKRNRRRAVTVPLLGEVSKMANGLIKIEGYAPRPFEQLTELEQRLLKDVILRHQPLPSPDAQQDKRMAAQEKRMRRLARNRGKL